MPTTRRCRRSRSSSPSRARTSACTRGFKALRGLGRVRGAYARRASASSKTSCAISASAARSCRPPEKARFLEVQEELAKLSSRFQDNVLDATNDFALYVTDDRAALGHSRTTCSPPRSRRPRRTASAGWKLTLHMPCYMPGDAVRRPPRAARDDVPRVRHARLGVRQARVGQHARTSRASSSCASEARAAAGLRATSPRSRSPPRWPASPRRRSRSSRTWRGAPSPSPSATWRRCASSRAPS